MIDIGESLVGAYLRQVQGCHLVTFNQFLPGKQGEIDVIAMTGADDTVWLCEVTTHIQGFLLDSSKERETAKIKTKLGTLREYAETAFPRADHRYQWWSPYVATGWRTTLMAELEKSWAEEGLDLQFVINDAYTERFRDLYMHAAAHPSRTADPAYRMLQIISRLRGGKLSFSD